MSIPISKSSESPRRISHPQGANLYYKDTGMTIRMDLGEARMFLKDYERPPDFSAPEVVHIELTGECNLDCPYCYVLENQKEKVDSSEEEMEKAKGGRGEEGNGNGAMKSTRSGPSKELLFDLFRQLADMGVFQITFGGGEPFLRDDMVDLAREADRLGMNVTVTTNGTLLSKFTAEELSVFRQINISYHDHPDVDLEKAVKTVVETGIPCAISFIMSRKYEKDLPKVVELVKKFEIGILLLSYKPVIDDKENSVPLKEIRTIAFRLRDEGVKVSIDSMLSNECHMSERLATISYDGDVHPCSFVRESMGNITHTSFLDIWKNRPPKSPCPYAFLNE